MNRNLVAMRQWPQRIRKEASQDWLWKATEARFKFVIGLSLSLMASFILSTLPQRWVTYTIVFGGGILVGIVLREKRTWFVLGAIVGSVDLLLASRFVLSLLYVVGLVFATNVVGFGTRYLRILMCTHDFHVNKRLPYRNALSLARTLTH